MGLIHFDAHSDLWHGYYDNKDTHGTPFRRAIEENLIDPSISCQIGLRGPLYDKNDFSMSKDAGLLSITGPELHSMGIQKALSLVKNRIGNKKAYLTFDIDFIDPAFAPGTGTPVWGGLSSAQAATILRGLSGINMVGGDVVEVSPPFDSNGSTAVAGAHAAVELICLWAAGKAVRA